MNNLTKSTISLGVILLLMGSFLPGINANILNINKSDGEISPFSMLNGEYEYIIITDEYLENSDFQRLIEHKSQYLTCKIVTVEDILSNSDYSVNGKYGDATNNANGNHWVPNGKEVTKNFSNFDDSQARIRNFLRFAYDEWNTKYVLIGGDVDIVPVRKLRINETWWYSGTAMLWTYANIRSDLYYGCLDGTWNDDFDIFFGEDEDYSVDEEADWEAEIFVGRAPVNSKREVKTFVDKVINFETSVKPENMLFHQAGINQFNNPDSSVIPEICYEHIPMHYVVYKLYQINTNIPVSKYVRHWRDPDKLIVLHIGSGEKSFYYTERRITGDIQFTTDDVKYLDNTFCPVHISLSCNTGNFGLQHNSLAEEMLLYPDHGPSACIFNSFYGCSSEDDVHKYSGEFIEQEFYEIFQEGTDRLGEFVTKSKYYFINQAENDLQYRWCYYTVSLLGDPETSLFEVRNKISFIDEVYVDDDYDSSTPGWGVTHFDSITNAINNVEDSGTIYVNSGNYNENLVINKPCNLIGEDKATTTIFGDGNNDVIKIYDETKISGFTIQNSGISQNNAGIKIYSIKNIINNNTITNNKIGLKIETAIGYNANDNKIYNNNFINNTQNAQDTYENKYYGNYWDDYTGKDNNGDGIGDSKYESNSVKDLCPFITESDWDSGVNHLPILPIITGPRSGKPNTPYSYDFLSADPDGDNIYYYIDMGDFAYDEWDGPFSPYETKNILYYWERTGIYTIKAKVKDSTGAETDWIRYKVTMPRNKVSYTPFNKILERLIDMFKNFKILEFLIKL